jgi:hypothetical protein
MQRRARYCAAQHSCKMQCYVILSNTALQVALSGACPDKLRPAAVVSLTAALGEIGGPMLLTHAWAHALRATATTAASTATAAAGADAATAAAAAFAYDARLPVCAAAAVCGVLYVLTLVLHVNGVSSLAALLSGSTSSSSSSGSSRSALEGVLEIPIRDFMSLVGAEHTVQEQTVKRS